MKRFMLCTVLACNISAATYTKTLQDKSSKFAQKESWATHCRKRKTDKNKKIYVTPSSKSIAKKTDHSTKAINHSPYLPKKQEESQPHIKSPIKKLTARVDSSHSINPKESIYSGKNDDKKIETLQPALTDSEPILPEQPPVVIADIAATQSRPSTQTNTRTITVKNGVTKKMRTYKHWGTSHEPTFTLRANGIEIPQKGQAQVTLTDNKLDTDYHADFYGMRTSADKVSFIVDADTSEITITFGWDKNPRIVIDGATVTQEK